MTYQSRLVEVIETEDVLGEGVLWRGSDETVWWTDIQGRRLHRLDWRSKKLHSWTTPERLCSFAFVRNQSDLLLAAFESGFAFYRPDQQEHFWISRLPELGDGLRLNDGRVDSRGRFWAGSMIEGELKEGATPGGVLYMLDAIGEPHQCASGIHISNGLCWSPDGGTIYFADSPRGEISKAAFDPGTNKKLEWRPFAKVSRGSPDGAVTDCEGNYWSALWGAGEIVCLSPDGREIYSLPVDAPQPTCPVFGGRNLDLLFVTSATEGLDEAALASAPKSGSLFVFETTARGLPVREAAPSSYLMRHAGGALR